MIAPDLVDSGATVAGVGWLRLRGRLSAGACVMRRCAPALEKLSTGGLLRSLIEKAQLQARTAARFRQIVSPRPACWPRGGGAQRTPHQRCHRQRPLITSIQCLSSTSVTMPIEHTLTLFAALNIACVAWCTRSSRRPLKFHLSQTRRACIVHDQ
jgi:hypothetical protein